MKRGFCLTALTLLGVVLAMTTHDARQASERLMAKQVADNLYMLVPAPGHPPSGPVGNTAVFVMSTGVALVDTKVAGYGPDILAQVRGLTDKPVTTIINSHTHFDHTGSNNLINRSYATETVFTRSAQEVHVIEEKDKRLGNRQGSFPVFPGL